MVILRLSLIKVRSIPTSFEVGIVVFNVFVLCRGCLVPAHSRR